VAEAARPRRNRVTAAGGPCWAHAGGEIKRAAAGRASGGGGGIKHQKWRRAESGGAKKCGGRGGASRTAAKWRRGRRATCA